MIRVTRGGVCAAGGFFRHLEPTLETVFMMPAEQYTYLSSRLIKEVFSLGGDVRGLVPPAVERWMRRKKETVTS